MLCRAVVPSVCDAAFTPFDRAEAAALGAIVKFMEPCRVPIAASATTADSRGDVEVCERVAVLQGLQQERCRGRADAARATESLIETAGYRDQGR